MNSEAASDNNELRAPEYILENFEASDRIAILLRDSKRAETIQRVTTAENAASQDFQAWLRHKNLTSDVYIGMNTLKRDAQNRTKEDVEKIRHLYLDIDRRGPEALETIRKSNVVPTPELRAPNVSREISGRLEGGKRQPRAGGGPPAGNGARVRR